MGTDNTPLTTASLQTAVQHSSVTPNTRERTFFCLGLTCAAALHAALIFGVSSSLPRHMGERDGSVDGISVDLVDEADVLSKTTVPMRTEASPAQSKAAKSDSPATDMATPSTDSRDEQKAAASSIAKDEPDLLSLPDPSKKKSESKADKKNQPRPRQPLDLSPRLTAPETPVSPGGRSASVSRPPGVTRSGENDDFGRGVIRALRQTMPGSRGTVGRVTIRLFLSQNGNLDDVQVVKSAGDASLDQSVVFAAKQASFPIPPSRSTLGDRTFLVTYIYE
jgi:periplasmic protein TonB